MSFFEGFASAIEAFLEGFVSVMEAMLIGPAATFMGLLITLTWFYVFAVLWESLSPDDDEALEAAVEAVDALEMEEDRDPVEEVQEQYAEGEIDDHELEEELEEALELEVDR